MNKQSEEQIKNNIIIAYRQVIDNRYNYKNLKQHYDVPKEFTPEVIDEFRDFFLRYIYPEIPVRIKLDKAFDSLDAFIHNPKKLLSLVMYSSSLVFKYGLQLPKILRAGIQALESFRAAVHFEGQLTALALDRDIHSLNETAIQDLIRSLDIELVEDFIIKGERLFLLLLDRKLLLNTTEIIEFIIKKMVDKPKVFNKDDILGLEIALEMLTKGTQLFDRLDYEQQKTIIHFVSMIERNAIDMIFEK